MDASNAMPPNQRSNGRQYQRGPMHGTKSSRSSTRVRSGPIGSQATVTVETAADLDAPVTCFVGENGSGKSTLLESIAIAAGLPSVGLADRAQDDPTLADQQLLARALKLTWRSRSYRGFFLRAEDFFGFQLQLIGERAALEAELMGKGSYTKPCSL